jgi:UDP-glucose:(heptosyl)LPS alpha-1,3-glucosyltransferase
MENFAARLAEMLASEGRYEIHVFANQWQKPSASPIRFHLVPKIPGIRVLRPWIFALAATALVRKGRFEIIHTHDRFFGADIISLHGCPHSFWTKEIRKKKPSLFDRSMCATERRMFEKGRNPVFLPVSNLTMNKFQEEYPEVSGQWKVIQPGCDLERFSAGDSLDLKADFRKKHGIPESDFLILFVGMNFEAKGLETAISALALARRKTKGPPISLLVVGKGDSDKFQRQAASKNVAQSVFFAGIQNDALDCYYKSADALLLLSEFEAFGMVVLEAMASGLPVIIGPDVGARDFVRNGENGFIVRSVRDPEEVAEKIANLSSGERSIEMGKNASRGGRSRPWEACAAEVNEVYESILGRKSPK